MQRRASAGNHRAAVSPCRELAGLLRETGAYVDALGAYRAGDARPILERFASAGRFAAFSGTTLVDDLAAELEDARTKVAGLRIRVTAWRVLPHLVVPPVINARYLTANIGLNDVTAQRALAQLTERGVLEERTGKQRNRVWQHPGILNVLDAYAQELRRGVQTALVRDPEGFSTGAAASDPAR